MNGCFVEYVTGGDVFWFCLFIAGVFWFGWQCGAGDTKWEMECKRDRERELEATRAKTREAIRAKERGCR